MKTAVASYVHGWYLDFIPLQIFSILNAYPACFVKIFTDQNLPKEIINNLNFIESKNYSIETIFENYPFNNKRCLRWFIPEHYFEEFDYILFCDIDLIMLEELPSFQEQRIKICHETQLPFANYEREQYHALPKRVTGWHFVIKSQYFSAINDYSKYLFNKPEKIEELHTKEKYNNGINEVFNDEHILYEILNNSFKYIPINKFPTHHGIHLGPLRGILYKHFLSNNISFKEHLDKNIIYWNKKPQIYKIINNKIFNNIKNNLTEYNTKYVINRFIKCFNNIKI